MSTRSFLTTALLALPLTLAASCPYAQRGSGSARSEPVLPRASPDGPDFGRCPRKSNVAGGGTRSTDWWPCELSLAVLRQNGAASNPMDAEFDYAAQVATLDVEALKKDIEILQKDSQVWWPADYGDYGPFFVRLAWHSAGTYRSKDGRGGPGMGQQRFAPLNSWPDNTSLDKARRLLWPIKQKYGSKLSWSDLFVFTGHMALINMGAPSIGFGFGRPDSWQADEGIYWGTEHEFFPGKGSNTDRYNGSSDAPDRATKLESPLANTNMGLIYVDPRGPNGIPDPLASALNIRETFARMGMDDEETVALISGGHAFGKTHGAVEGKNIGPEPNAAPIELQGLGWKNSVGSGVGNYSYTSGLEVIWTRTPTKWSNDFLTFLLSNEWTLTKSIDGAPQWEAQSSNASFPDPFNPNESHKPTMLTSDLGLLRDPIYRPICEKFQADFETFGTKFAEVWYKLVHRDMGPISRYIGPDVPSQVFIWQDPLPAVTYAQIDDNDVQTLKQQILGAPGLNVSNLVTTAWGSASTFRFSDKRGGGNGARINLEPQNAFAANNPERLKTVLPALQKVQQDFNGSYGGKQVSLADLIILGGAAAIEKAASDAGMNVNVPFTPGRVDTTQEMTDVKTFAFLNPEADGFRNYGTGTPRALTEELLVEKASLLTLNPPELTVLIGGMRALSANYDGSSLGIFTDRPGQLTNDFFVNLLDMGTTWAPLPGSNEEVFEGKDLNTGATKYMASRADLVFGSHPELRAVAEVYASADAQEKFVADFVAAWAKVMDLDRYDVRVQKAGTY